MRDTPRGELTTIDALESARILATNPQTRVADRIGAAADVCMGTCMATGTIGGTAIGALVAGPIGAERGFTIGFAAGTIAGEFICDPRFWSDAAGDSRAGSIPHAGAPDASVPDAGAAEPRAAAVAPGPSDDESLGGYTFPNGGGESNAGNTDTSGNVGVNTSGTEAADDQSSGSNTDQTDNSNSTCGGDGSGPVCADGMDDTNTGTNDLPADDGGDRPADPRLAFTDRRAWAITPQSPSLVSALGANSQITSLEASLGIRA